MQYLMGKAATLKQWVLRAADTTGVGSVLLNSQWRRQRLAILCYHGISIADEHVALPELYMTAPALRRRMQYLRENDFAVLPLSEALERLYDGRLPARAVAVTFDDGTRDFAERAVPILQEFAIPATVYLTTYYSERRFPVFDTALRYMLWRSRKSDIDPGKLLGITSGGPLRVDTSSARRVSSRAIGDWARHEGLSGEEKHDLLRKLAAAAVVNFEAFLASGQFQIMTPEQVGALPRPLIDIELHTHRHRTPRDETLFVREIIDNKNCIKRLADDRDPVHFCYPSGDYCSDFLPWLEALGVRSATTCIPALATRQSHRLLLPRFVDTMAISDDLFAAWLNGTAEWLPRKRMYQLNAETAASVYPVANPSVQARRQ